MNDMIKDKIEWNNAENSGEPKKYYKVIKLQDYIEGKTNLYTFRLYTPSLARVVAGRTGDILRDLDGNEVQREEKQEVQND